GRTRITVKIPAFRLPRISGITVIFSAGEVRNSSSVSGSALLDRKMDNGRDLDSGGLCLAPVDNPPRRWTGEPGSQTLSIFLSKNGGRSERSERRASFTNVHFSSPRHLSMRPRTDAGACSAA